MTAWAAALILAGAVGGCAARAAAVPTPQQVERSLPLLDALPVAAQRAVLRETPGSKYREVFTEQQLGRTVHLVLYTSPAGAAGEIHVTGDGRVLFRDQVLEVVRFDAVPELARRALLARTGGIQPATARRHVSRGRELFTFDVMLAGVPHGFQIDSRGMVHRHELAIAPGQIPVVVEASLRRPFLDLVITQAVEVRSGADVSYRVSGTSGGRSVLAVLGADGTMRSLRMR